MNIVSCNKEDMTVFGKKTNCNVYTIHVQISDVKKHAADLIDIIRNTSWLNDLDIIDQVAFQARASRTVDRLVNDIFTKVDNRVTSDFGEYVVSVSAQLALETQSHTRLPLAELIKEKVIGNPGFDFHTESPVEILAFGEAKYNSTSNPYSIAASQIIDFIALQKDIAELAILKNFIKRNTAKNAIAGQKAYVAAFSINSTTPLRVFHNALSSSVFDPLLAYNDLYLIGVEICA